ncbi:MAG: carbamate kinase [Hyphomicrobiaceae bacterium]|nr:carbamate kinase [Hyphomicrobiaceae bacterium]
MRIVAALGGNALLRRGEPLTDAAQQANVRRAAGALASLCDGPVELIVTHGNGPQVGLLALQSAAGPPGSEQSLDVLNAESEGMLGYLIERELRNALPPGRQVVSILSQVLVDPADPAFACPSKPIGPLYAEAEARRLASEHGWSVTRDVAGWRRVVASPTPVAVLEIGVIELLVSRGIIVVCVGGGGIPVARGGDGLLHGVECVIDKDRASALLAQELRADCLLLLTDVDAVYADWGTSRQRAIVAAGPDDIDVRNFAAGSMRPKIEAAIEVARGAGIRAVIGRLEDAAALVQGGAGTTVTPAWSGLVLRD